MRFSVLEAGDAFELMCGSDSKKNGSIFDNGPDEHFVSVDLGLLVAAVKVSSKMSKKSRSRSKLDQFIKIGGDA